MSVEVVLFLAFWPIFLGILWCADRLHTRRLEDHNQKMDELYRAHRDELLYGVSIVTSDGRRVDPKTIQPAGDGPEGPQ